MKTHRTDGVSLTFALLFALVLAWWLVAGRMDIQLPALGWLVAAALIVFGLLGLLGALRANRAANEQPVSASPVSASPVSATPASASPASGTPVTGGGPAAPPAPDYGDEPPYLDDPTLADLDRPADPPR